MSCVIVATPLIIASWPAITACVTAAVTSLGYSVAAGTADEVVTSQYARKETPTSNKVTIDAEESEVLENALMSPGGDNIVVTRDGVTATFTRDPRGGLKLCMEGEHLSKAELRRRGEELMGRVTQQYAYHKVVSELKSRGMTILEETVTADRSVKIRIRA